MNSKMLLILFVIAVYIGYGDAALLSSNKPTVQTSVSGEFVASNCVDGKLDTVCQTNVDYPSSWTVDLQGSSSVSHVVLHNRADCCSEKIVGLIIELLSKSDEVLHECGRIMEDKASVSIRCCNTMAAKIRIRQTETQNFQLAEVEVHGDQRLSGQDNSGIISRGKPTNQSSSFKGLKSSLAVDGKYDNNLKTNNIENPSCFQTNENEIGFWMVDLQEKFVIDRVVIYNRMDCCTDKLIGASVELLNQDGQLVSECESIMDSKHIYNISCGNKMAHKVRIRGTEYKPLHLCEVDVFQGTGFVLISRGKPTSQSTIFQGLDSSLGVDGNYRTIGKVQGILNFQCFHTGCGGNEWWVVDLKETYNIDHVLLYNRFDSNAQRIIGSSLELLTESDEATHTCGQMNEVQPIYNISCEQKPARKVRVKGPENQCLHLCEVDVIGAIGQAAPSLVSRGKPTVMSSLYENLTSELGVDGNYDLNLDTPTKYFRNCFETYNEMGYWMVDLQGTFIIDHVVLYGRTDCCSENIVGAVVEVLSDTKAVLHECGSIAEPNSTYRIVCGGKVGQKVRVRGTQKNSLTLCEVDVFGTISL